MLYDARGLELSTDSPEAAQAASAMADSYAGFRVDVGDLVKQALAADAGFAFAHILRGYLMLLMGVMALLPAARKALAAAEPLLARATPREQEHAQALRAWISGDIVATTVVLERIIAQWPLDLLALRMVHLLHFRQGNRERLRDCVGETLEHWEETTPGYHYLLGMHAFGQEECGQYDRAEASGRRSVELEPTDHWATHAVAHVLEMQGRHREGIAWLEHLKGHWPGANDFINHLWWHRSLYHLELEQFDQVLGIYDEQIRSGPLDFYLVMHNAASLLWRLELCGQDVGTRWAELGAQAASTLDDHSDPFTDMHYAMALLGAKDAQATARHQASLRDDACHRPGSWAAVFREVTVPLCGALAAFRSGKPAAAVESLRPVMAGLHRAGGSHAQRDVVAQTLIAAALAAEQYPLARELLAQRTREKSASAWSWKHYAQALSALSDDAGATAARDKAARLLA